MSQPIDLRNFAAFAAAMREVRRDFPQNAAEIDRCIDDVGRKIEACDDPNCTCRMTFKNFRAISNPPFPTE